MKGILQIKETRHKGSHIALSWKFNKSKNHSERNNSGFMGLGGGGKGIACKKVTTWGNGNILYLACDCGYPTISIWKDPLVNFKITKL